MHADPPPVLFPAGQVWRADGLHGVPTHSQQPFRPSLIPRPPSINNMSHWRDLAYRVVCRALSTNSFREFLCSTCRQQLHPHQGPGLIKLSSSELAHSGRPRLPAPIPTGPKLAALPCSALDSPLFKSQTPPSPASESPKGSFKPVQA